ncbi:sortilin-like, partial [Clarias magur]
MRVVCWPAVLVSAALLCLDFAHALGRRESTALLRRQRRSGTSGLGDFSQRTVKRSEGSLGDSPCLSLQDDGAGLQQDTHT